MVTDQVLDTTATALKVLPIAGQHPAQLYLAKLLVTASNSGFGQAFLYIYFAAEFLAPLLMGIALWRSRTVPRWLAVGIPCG